ncbi:MAG: hypothetical protein C5B55_12390 [Blastocatellia bacterium]|nr:MAG: hypothetical protein C5B55_12390 [Blastocatellia bacterium]
MLYVYCVTEEQVNSVDFARGIEQAPVESYEKDNLIVFLSRLERDTIGITRQNILTHDSVIRSVLEFTTPLPFRFSTLVSAERLENFIGSRGPELCEKLREIRGCVEMSVKVILEPGNPTSAQDDNVTLGKGAAFLLAKRREILGDEKLTESARQISDWVRTRLSAHFRAEEVVLRPSKKLVLSASHLVERANIGAYQEAARELMSARLDLHFLVSGPWAPYSFANIDLEFKTRFGVS